MAAIIVIGYGGKNVLHAVQLLRHCQKHNIEVSTTKKLNELLKTLHLQLNKIQHTSYSFIKLNEAIHKLSEATVKLQPIIESYDRACMNSFILENPSPIPKKYRSNLRYRR